MRMLRGLLHRLLGVGSSSVAQAIQSLTSMVVLMLAARLLGIETLGLFSILYGALILAAAITSGFIGDTLMVLNRHDPHIQAALRAWFALLTVALGVAAFGLSLLGTGFGPGAAACYALAAMAYVFEDLMRRSHMAVMNFARVIVIDLVVLGTTGSVLLACFLLQRMSIEVFLLAILAGQLAGALYGWRILPATEKVIPARPARMRAVAGYGVWRSALQGLRPAQLTGTRVLVTVLVTLAAAGQLEAARIYSAPAMLLVTGTCAYFFADLARRADQPISRQLRTTDAVVLKLFAATVACTVIGLALLPWGGPLLTGIVPSAPAVAGWLAYSSAVAFSTPYGLLAAVREKARPVFLLRFMDSVLSLGLVALVLWLTGDYQLVPWASAAGALIGGLSIRKWVLGAIISTEKELEGAEHGVRLHGGRPGMHVARKDTEL